MLHREAMNNASSHGNISTWPRCHLAGRGIHGPAFLSAA